MLTIRKRGKYFHVRGTIRVGRETRVVKEHSCGTDRRDDAEAYRSKLETDIRHEILHGRGGRTHTLTIADAGLRYIDRPGGVRSYDLWRVDQINHVVGDRPIAHAADAWTQFKRVRCSGLLPSTVQRFKATFAAAVNYIASEEGFDAPKLPRGEKASNKRIRYLRPEQADRLIAAYATHVQPIVTVLRWQGLRIGEALRADWVHVNWQANSIFVPESKNGEPRTVTMHKRHARHCTASGCRADRRPRGRFSWPIGESLTAIRAVTRCRAAAQSRKRTPPHADEPVSLISTCTTGATHWASHWVMAGIDLETIRQEGGWKSLRMVERYAAVSAAHRTRAMSKLK